MPVLMRMRQKAASRERWDIPPRGLAVLSVLGGSVVLAGASILPGALILPALSVVTILAASIVAAVAWQRPRNPLSAGVTYWDVAGALTLIAICAALLSEPEAVLPILETRRNG